MNVLKHGMNIFFKKMLQTLQALLWHFTKPSPVFKQHNTVKIRITIFGGNIATFIVQKQRKLISFAAARFRGFACLCIKQITNTHAREW